MESLKEVFIREIEELRQLGHKFINGEATRAEFKGVSGGMGVYSHRCGKEFMVRLRIPSGIIAHEQLKFVYELASKYGLDKVHLTTRQAIQLHGLSIDETCNVMIDALENGIYTRGAGGNFPRNVAISPLSGVEQNEVFDVAPYAIEVNNHFMSKINTYKLPRKLKVAFSNGDKDQAHCTAVDQGFVAVNKDGKEYFEVYIGGGLGRNPKLSVKFNELVEPSDVLYHIEAITSLFIAEGDYENKAKARIRYILDRMGEEEFVNCYKKHLQDVVNNHGDNLKLNIEQNEINKIGNETNLTDFRLVPQKQQGLYSVHFQPIGGQLQLEVLNDVLECVKAVENIEFRLTMTEGLYIRNLNSEEAEKLIQTTKGKGGETRLEQSVACIGVPTCQMGAINGQQTLNEIVQTFREAGITKDILPRVFISGCPNSCGVHQLGSIGLAGKIKRIDNVSKNVFELYVNGDLGVGKTKLGKHYGEVLQENVPQLLLELAKCVDNSNIEFIQWVESNEDEFNNTIKEFLV